MRTAIARVSNVFLASLVLAAPVSAGPATLRFDGFVTQVTIDRPPWNAAAVGQLATFIFTFEQNTPDSYAPTDGGVYYDAVTSVSVTIGDVTATGAGGDIVIINAFVDVLDHYDIEDMILPDGFKAELFLRGNLECSTPMVSDELPKGVTHGEWEQLVGYVEDTATGFGILIDWYSIQIVPTPAPTCRGDADGNGTVNFADITEVLREFAQDCK